MRHSPGNRIINRLQPTIVGAGLVALDVVVNTVGEGDTKHYAGGTCGNVLTILSFLGWDAKPVSRLKNDMSSEWLLNDLARWGVDLTYISRTEDGSTPVIIQNIRENSVGRRTHSFSMRCPCCSAYLPGYKSIVGTVADEVSAKLPPHQVFFFDRVSRGTLNLANASAKRGAIIIFEPSGIGEPRLFREAWDLAHIVKYSNERIRDIADLNLKSTKKDGQLLLEIETLGEDGLRFRSYMRNSANGWKKLSGIPVTTLRDAAGSGDWCTAGLIRKLAAGGLRGLERVTTDSLYEALRYGQALATWNCSFDAARGGMYCVNRSKFDRQIRKLLSGETIRQQPESEAKMQEDLSNLCPTCESVTFHSRKKSLA